MRAVRIEDHAAIGDGRSAALVARDGTVDWLCWPRFDSPAVFAALLDPEQGGALRISPRGRSRIRRAYLEETNVLVTWFDLGGGARLRLVDFMPVGSGGEHGYGYHPEHELLRVATCEAGEVELDVEVWFRPGFGAPGERFRLEAGGPLGIRLEHRRSLYTLRATVPLALGAGARATAHARLRGGESLQLSLCHDDEAPAVLPPLGARVEDALARTVGTWRAWARRTRYAGPFRDAVVRSALVLKLLSYAASGAIVAAPTTSLPERIGGPFNWDYRFCWFRDAALTVNALLALGHRPEAEAFVSWLLHTTRLTRPEIRVLYDVHGVLPTEERELGWLAGYARSRPVRVGNLAAHQLQLDGYGEVVDALARLVEVEGELDRETRKLLRELGGFLRREWRLPDAGIWERRGPPTPHVHSLALVWTALDRLLTLAGRGMLRRGDVQGCAEARARVREEIEARGFDARLGSYVTELDGSQVGAALLQLGWCGYAEDRGPRLAGTWARVRERLDAGASLVWRDEQGRADGEGAFVPCSFWAAAHLARAGRLAEAESRFERLLAYANDVGLLSEELHPFTFEALGNFPQGFSHAALIDAALALEEARRSAAPTTERVRWRGEEAAR
jgi:GH15 family glucan-1,4-alpha-glucosidase